MNRHQKIKQQIVFQLGIILFSYATALLTRYNQVKEWEWEKSVTAGVIVLVLIESIGALSNYMVKKAKRLNHEELSKKITPMFVVFIIAVFLISNVVISISVFVHYIVNDIDLNYYWENLFKYELGVANKNVFVWMLMFSFVFFYILWNKSVKKQQELYTEKLKQQYQTMKSQISPHFVFNNLNTLSELVYQDAQKADQYIQNMSLIYRYIIENENADLVSLQKEIEFAQNYFLLQKGRAGNKVDLIINCDNTENYLIVPVSLQIVVENAIKHNAFSKENPLVIEINQNSEFIEVKNKIKLKLSIESSTKTGLSNLQKRNELILNRNIEYFEKDNFFHVKIPILKKQNESTNS